MKTIYNALVGEILKNKHAKITWITFLAFAIGPIMASLFMVIFKNPNAISESSLLSAKARMFAFSADWNSFLGILDQVIAMGGFFVFGFVASWIFGREYSDHTAKDLLALPISRNTIIHSKFITYFLWCSGLAISNLIVGLILGILLNLEGFESVILISHLKIYLTTTLLTILVGTPIAFIAIIGSGYLAPLGFVVFTLMLAQVMAAFGLGNYIPWAVPALISGAAGEFKESLNIISYLILISTSLIGYALTLAWWKHADQK